MRIPHQPPALTALLYREGSAVDVTMSGLAQRLSECGYRVAGVVQLNERTEDRPRCQMVLKELSSGTNIRISEDRGPAARGCMLDVTELTRATSLVAEALAQSPDLLIVNKFGKIEASGRGFRPLIADAMANGVPVLIAVPYTNLDSWRMFVGEHASEVALADLPPCVDEALSVLGFKAGSSPSVAALHTHATD